MNHNAKFQKISDRGFFRYFSSDWVAQFWMNKFDEFFDEIFGWILPKVQFDEIKEGQQNRREVKVGEALDEATNEPLKV